MLTIAITTVLLLLPILIGDASAATRLVLSASHLMAAGTIVPQLALARERQVANGVPGLHFDRADASKC